MLKITEIPVELLTLILQKVNGRTLCRLRQTCKVLDEIVEANRFFINARLPTSTLWFRLQKQGCLRQLSVTVVNRIVEWEKMDLEPISRSTEITDPFRELSGLSFQRIVIHSDELLSAIVLHAISIRLIEKLRMTCRFLCLSKTPERLISDSLRSIKCENLSVERPADCPKTIDWNAQGCKKLFLKDVPKENLLQLMSLFEEVSVEFEGSGWSKLDAAVKTVNDFIEAQTRSTERRKLKKCIMTISKRLIYANGRRDCKSAALNHLYTNVSPNGMYVDYYKANIAGGEMLIIEKHEFPMTTFTIHLCAGSIRKTLFEELNAAENSGEKSFYSDFMNAANDEDAIEEFHRFYEMYRALSLAFP